MRIVCGESPDTMETPIKHVMRHIQAATVNIAPERGKEFDTTFPDFTLEYFNDSSWIC